MSITPKSASAVKPWSPAPGSQWNRPPPLGQAPSARCGHSTTKAGTKLYLFGGTSLRTPTRTGLGQAPNKFLSDFNSPLVAFTPPQSAPSLRHSHCRLQNAQGISKHCFKNARVEAGEVTSSLAPRHFPVYSLVH